MSERNYRPSTRRKARVVFMAALLLAGCIATWAEATASQSSVAPAISSETQAEGATPGQATKPLGSVLNADGTLNLSSRFSGSLDASGWQMVSAAGEPPRFAPSATKAHGQPDSGKPDAAGDENWDDRFGGPGTDNTVRALAVSGSDVFVGGDFTRAGGISANHVAKWDSTTGTWSALGSGVGDSSNSVYALAVIGSDIFVGGNFTQAGGISANRIAMWNSTTGTWSALGTGATNGTNGAIFALAASGSDLYVGGYFSQAGGIDANHVARWDGTSWYSLGNGNENGITCNPCEVYSLLANGAYVYVGGQFSEAGTVSVHNIALWHNNAWSDLSGGVIEPLFGSSQVNAMVFSGYYVYVGGHFGQAGGMSANNIARWNGVNWEPLNGDADNGTNNDVSALAATGSDLYVGGLFTQVGGVGETEHLAIWNGSTWSGFTTATDGPITALAISGSDVYLGGTFTSGGGTYAHNVARWSSTTGTWFDLQHSVDSIVNAVAVDGSDVYVGGGFTQVGGVSANHVAVWNSATNVWSALVSGTANGTNGSVTALAVSGSDVYVGGTFTSAGGTSASNIAKWDGATNTWSPVGIGTNSGVLALAASGSDLYVGGYFTSAGGISANYIAKWDSATSTWSPLGSGTNSYVTALAASGSDVYVGGNFMEANGTTANFVAKWDSATSIWSSLGSGTTNGTNSSVYALAISGSNVYVGGQFTQAGGASANDVAKWDSASSTWSSLGSGAANGTNDTVYALAVSGSDVYVGGQFTRAGGANVLYIAMWDGSTWSALGSGTDSHLYALAGSGSTSDVYVGGIFMHAGGKSSNYFGIWHSPIAPTPTPTATHISTPSPTPTQCTLQFEDVPNPSTFYAYVQCLACRGIINGYACGGTGEPCNTRHDPYFRPSHNVTRGQIAKIIALSAGIHTPVSGQTFEDVPRGSTFYTYTEQLYALQVMNGYPCGGPGEPCNPPNSRPYFRPNANATRGQLAKIDANAAGCNDPPSGQTFQDVAVASTFYTYTQRLTSRGVMSGYACGGAGEPCIPPGNLPYFRPNADVTRGQTSKIVGNTFFPDCQTEHD